MPKKTTVKPRFYRIADVATYLNLCRATIYNTMRRDPSFPRSVKLTSRTVAWPREEIEAWATERIDRARRQGRQPTRSPGRVAR